MTVVLESLARGFFLSAETCLLRVLRRALDFLFFPSGPPWVLCCSRPGDGRPSSSILGSARQTGQDGPGPSGPILSGLRSGGGSCTRTPKFGQVNPGPWIGAQLRIVSAKRPPTFLFLSWVAQWTLWHTSQRHLTMMSRAAWHVKNQRLPNVCPEIIYC